MIARLTLTAALIALFVGCGGRDEETMAEKGDVVYDGPDLVSTTHNYHVFGMVECAQQCNADGSVAMEWSPSSAYQFEGWVGTCTCYDKLLVFDTSHVEGVEEVKR